MNIKLGVNYDVSNIESTLNKLVIYNKIGQEYDKYGCNGITMFTPLSIHNVVNNI